MISAFRVRALVTMVLALMCMLGHAADTCEEPDPLLPDVTVVLECATKAVDGIYVGHFAIENQRISPEISIRGRKNQDVFYVHS